MISSAPLFTDGDRLAKRMRDDIAPKVAADRAYQIAEENAAPAPAKQQEDRGCRAAKLKLASLKGIILQSDHSRCAASHSLRVGEPKPFLGKSV
jgi:hypothetical protein